MWIDAVRRVPSSPPSSSVGASAETAPRVVVSRQADSTSSTAKAMSWTPSPWRADVLGDLAVGRQRRGEHEPDVVLDHDVARPVADLRLEAAEGDRREAPQGAVVGGRLAGVADPELDVVDALERQEVGRLGVGVRVDPGAGLVGGAARDRSRSSRVSPAAGGAAGPAHAASRPVIWPSMLRLACHTGAHGRRPARPTARRREPAWRPRARRSRPASRGRWPRRFDDSDEARWGPPRGPRPCRGDGARTGSARSSGSWPAAASRVPFGRIATDPCGSASSSATGRCPPRELFDRIDAAPRAARAPLARR